MPILTSTIIGSFALAAAAATPVAVPYETSLDAWQPAVGDTFVVDTMRNEGYLVHDDGEFVRFPVITGQRRWVNYIGRSYNAATPNWNWQIKSKHIKGDRVTFGPSGRFLRLYKDDEQTAYGIHEHKSEAEMFARDARFQSMGCVIVRTNVMDVIERTYDLNAAAGMNVFTRYGVENPVYTAFPSAAQPVAMTP